MATACVSATDSEDIVKLALVALTALLLTVGSACMRVPAGLHVIVTDTPEDYCIQRANCYRSDLRAIVVVPGQSLKLWAHETCHAHQHQTVLDETGSEPDVDLHQWLDTNEGIEYAHVVSVAGPTDWGNWNTLLENFAEACGRFLTDQLTEPGRFAFFKERSF
jgi:hypothetical protein